MTAPVPVPEPFVPRPAPLAPTPGDFRLEGSFTQGGVARGQAPPGTFALTLDARAVPFAPDGRFLIGFDRDARTSALLLAQTPSGAITQTLTVTGRAWNIQSLPTLRRGTTPSAAFQRLRSGEVAQIEAARSMTTVARGWRAPFRWPLTGRISGVFGSQRIYAGEPGAYHSGIDIARPSGTPVSAPADGVVILAASAPFSLEGNLLMVDHGAGLNSAFLHLSRIDVRVGDHVRQGQTLGLVGMTGRATGPHLHWSLRWGAARLDPALLLPPMPPTGVALSARSPDDE